MKNTLLISSLLATSATAFAPGQHMGRVATSMRMSTAPTINGASAKDPVQAIELHEDETAREEMLSEESHSEHEYLNLDMTKTVYQSSIKSPKDAYVAFAEKGAANAKMAKRKILHQSILGGCYVGFGGLVSLAVAGNMGGIGAMNPGLTKMAFAALFPVNLLLIVTTGAQLFTGNSATVSSAKYEGLVTWRELMRNWGVSIAGNVIGCGLMALVASYCGLLTGGTAELCAKTAVGKCAGSFGQNFVKAIMCNWMVSLALFMAGASNDLAGKMVGIWFPISTFVAIGLEHSVANMFIMPAALLMKCPLTLGNVLMKNIIPVLLGNAVAGALVVAGSYSYQFGRLGGKRRAIFAEKLAEYEARKQRQRIRELNQKKGVLESIKAALS